MKWLAALAVVASVLDAQPNPYRTIDNALRPAGRTLGWVMGLDVDRDGRSIWVFDACGGMTCVDSTVAPIMKFDRSGKVVKSFGAGRFAHPHGLYVDRQDNVWAIDGFGGPQTPVSPTTGQQVLKFSPDGTLLMTLGTAGVPGESATTFNMPSDVLAAPNGDIFVADGHGNNTNARIVKFSRDGRFIKAWGRRGTAPGEFDNPHSLAMDSRGRLFVADRYNFRIQIFDQNGTFLEAWTQFGSSSEMFIDRHDVLYSANITVDEKAHPGWKKGVIIGDARTGNVTGFVPDPDPNASLELIAADADGNLYGGLTLGKSVRKFVRIH